MMDSSGLNTGEARRLTNKQQLPKTGQVVKEKKEAQVTGYSASTQKFQATEDFCQQDTNRADNTHPDYNKKCAQCLYRVYNKDSNSLKVKQQAEGYNNQPQGMFFTQCYAPSYTFNVACRCHSYSMEDCWCEAFPAGVGFLTYVLIPLLLIVYYCCICSCLKNKFCPLSICVAKYRRWAIENGIDIDEGSEENDSGTFDDYESGEYG